MVRRSSRKVITPRDGISSEKIDRTYTFRCGENKKNYKKIIKRLGNQNN